MGRTPGENVANSATRETATAYIDATYGCPHNARGKFRVFARADADVGWKQRISEMTQSIVDPRSTDTAIWTHVATDEQLEAAAGLTKLGFTTWSTTDCSGCSVTVC